MDRLDFYFKQKVKSSEVDLGFDQVENALKAILTDVGITGILSGGTPQPEMPESLSIELAAAVSAYDKAGDRIQIPDAITTVDCSVDVSGAPTAVNTPGNERWLGVFLAHKRVETDPRVDGLDQPLFFLLTDSFEVRVRQGAEAAIGFATKVALRDDELLACDVRLVNAQTEIFAGDINIDRREDLLFLTAGNIAVDDSGWTYFISPISIQDVLDQLDTDLGGHFGGTSLKHPAADITYPGFSWISSTDVKGAFDEIVNDLGSTTVSRGSAHIGYKGSGGFGPATLQATMDALITAFEPVEADATTHISGAGLKHPAADITYPGFSWIAATDVDGALDEIVTELDSVTTGQGSAHVGYHGLSWIASDPLEDVLDSLIGGLEQAVAVSSGASRIGFNSTDVADNTPFGVSTGNLRDVLDDIVTNLNTFIANYFATNHDDTTNLGFHTTIEIENNTSAFHLLFDAGGTTADGIHFRIYSEATGGTGNYSAWLTVNAIRNIGLNQWEKDDDARGGFAIELETPTTGSTDFRIHHQSSVVDIWTAWTSTARMFNAGGYFQLSGTLFVTGASGMADHRQHTGSGTVFDSTTIDFKTDTLVPPTVINLTVDAQNSWGDGSEVVQASDITRYGFRLNGSSNAVTTAGTLAYWHGHYTGS